MQAKRSTTIWSHDSDGAPYHLLVVTVRATLQPDATGFDGRIMGLSIKCRALYRDHGMPAHDGITLLCKNVSVAGAINFAKYADSVHYGSGTKVHDYIQAVVAELS